MLKLHLLLIPVRQATDIGGLGLAAQALPEAGLIESLAAEAEIDRVDLVELEPDAVTGDIEVDLGLLNNRIAEVVKSGIERGAAPLIAGGTCNHIIGMISGLQQSYPGERIGLLWLDAHGDFNTPRTSMSGMLGGMPVAVAAGLCWPRWREISGMTGPLPTNRIVMVDVRDLDPAEEALIRASDVEIARFDDDGGTSAISEAIVDLADRVDHLYVHIDADILDSRFQPNHPTTVSGGPDPDQVKAVTDCAMATGKVRALAVVSIDPRGDGGLISVKTGMEMVVNGVSSWAANA